MYSGKQKPTELKLEAKREQDEQSNIETSSICENIVKRRQNDKNLSWWSVASKTTDTTPPSAPSTAKATQFSVQRSDVGGGLRMRISAIRPCAIVNADSEKVKKLSQQQQHSDTCNNNTATVNASESSGKTKLILSPYQQFKQEAQQQKRKQEKLAAAAAATTKKNASQPPGGATTNAVGGGALNAVYSAKWLEPRMSGSKKRVMSPCLSDATESGCSEATTTTTINATNDSGTMAKRIKVKRKKIPSKVSDSKRLIKKSRPHESSIGIGGGGVVVGAGGLSSDSEDDSALKRIPKAVQRSPRVLQALVSSSQLKLSSLTVISAGAASSIAHQHGSDNICLSSSDNELPELVSAAIKRVESDTDDTVDQSLKKSSTMKNKTPSQYQSSLLQDFMEKTLMLGQTTRRSPLPVVLLEKTSDVGSNCRTSSQTDTLTSGHVSSKRRRGRPKSSGLYGRDDDQGRASVASAASVLTSANITESADSGVISSTASTVQSSSSSPKTPNHTKQWKLPGEIKTDQVAGSSKAKSSSNIDIAYLDKRMYATERVLYPPRRNKGRQALSGGNKRSASSSPRTAQKPTTTKDDLHLDPIWRQIDVNKKFRRPSLSGYKSDGGVMTNQTICSKILAAKSGYVSDYGSFHPRSHHHTSGYKSDASGKSRLSTKSCVSRRSRAKSCGYRSDCKESGGGHLSGLKTSSKFRRKHRSALMKSAKSKSVENLNDDQDILQLAGLSLGQSSEESNEYMSKPALKQLPTTSESKKYGEINRFIATGEYYTRRNVVNFGGGGGNGHHSKRPYEEDVSQDGFSSCFRDQLLMQRQKILTSDIAPSEILLPTSRKIKSRRSSAASYCSSHFSSCTSRFKRRRRRKSFLCPLSSRTMAIDSKLLTEIDIITNKFGDMCRIRNQPQQQPQEKQEGIASSTSEANDKTSSVSGGNGGGSGGAGAVAGAGAGSAAVVFSPSVSGGGGSGKREPREKRTLKKRKAGESLDSASGIGSAASNCGSVKRRHKKTTSSSPDDHKLPLKKRHYLLIPGEKSNEAAKIFGQGHAVMKSASTTAAYVKSQQLSGGSGGGGGAGGSGGGGKSSKAVVTPKKRHLLQGPGSGSGGGGASSSSSHHHHHHQHHQHLDAIAGGVGGSSIKSRNSSPLRLANSAAGDSLASTTCGRLVAEVSPSSSNGRQPAETTVHKKRSRLEGVVSKIANSYSADEQKRDYNNVKSNAAHPIAAGGGASASSSAATTIASPISVSPTADNSCPPPPGVFEPSIELEIQIPAMTKIPDANLSIITKSEVDSPQLTHELHKNFGSSSPTKVEGTHSSSNYSVNAVSALISPLAASAANSLLKRKRKKINRTGFPTVRRKKRQQQQHKDLVENHQTTKPAHEITGDDGGKCSSSTSVGVASTEGGLKTPPRVDNGDGSPQSADRQQRTPRLSVVALERLQGSPSKIVEPSASLIEMKPTPPPQASLATLEPSVDSKQAKRCRRTSSNRTGEETQPVEGTASTSRRSARREKSLRAAAAAAAADESLRPTPTRSRSRSRVSTSAKRGQNAKEVTSTTTMTTNNPKVVTARSLQHQIKLPAGIDPNTNFSCKIRLNRRTSLQTAPITKEKTTQAKDEAGSEEKDNTSANADVDTTADEAPVDSSEETEHDVLPGYEQLAEFEAATAAMTSTSDGGRKMPRLKKSYLPAGLFSDYYKMDNVNSSGSGATTSGSGNMSGNARKSSALSTSMASMAASSQGTPTRLLPPPPYCERYLRRTQIDFLLPYDIWWAAMNAKLPARITVPSWNYRKIRTNVYAESVRPNTANSDQPTCVCKPAIGCDDNCLNRLVYTECSPSSCPTRENCRNQKIQRHEVAPGVERFMTENKGWGVRARLPIAKGTYILEYVGEVVTEREFKERMGSIYLNDIHHYCLHLDGGLVIDGHRMGSDGRFVNHSCEPNCEMQKWSVNGLSRMALFAKRPIKPGEELTYDYNFALFNPAEGQPCRCNTANCRGVIGGKSQRVRPLPAEAKSVELCVRDVRGRRRKRKAHKNILRLQSREFIVPKVQQLTEKEEKAVRQFSVFLVRNFKKVLRCKYKMSTSGGGQCSSTGTTARQSSKSSRSGSGNSQASSSTLNRRSSTPSPLLSPIAAHISALCHQRSMKTRGLTLAVQDPEIEKMAKMAVILRDICGDLEKLKCPTDENCQLIAMALNNNTISNNNNNKRKKSHKTGQRQAPVDLRTIKSNIEQGHYKQPSEFEEDMEKMLTSARQSEDNGGGARTEALDVLVKEYERIKREHYEQLLEVIGSRDNLKGFVPIEGEQPKVESQAAGGDGNGDGGDATKTVKPADIETPPQSGEDQNENPLMTSAPVSVSVSAAAPLTTPTPAIPAVPNGGVDDSGETEDIISCICGLYKDEGLMIQCARCLVWQHTECTQADVNAENYLCEKCEPRSVDREIPLDDFTEDGHRYYLSLMRDDLQVRQGDAVYVLRDIPIKDAAAGENQPMQKHTYKTIGNIDYSECDIFRVERLWKNDTTQKRYIFGHHFLRPHETFHEPSRRFYANEVVRVPLYEVIPIELVMARCWVLDRTTFCKGRPVECTSEEHCYICELRVDKTARFFSKAKINYPTCTKSYAFRKFPEKLKIAKTYAPHDVKPPMVKAKKQKTDVGVDIANNSSTTVAIHSSQDTNKAWQQRRQRYNHNNNNNNNNINNNNNSNNTIQSFKVRRSRLEDILKGLKAKNTQTAPNEPSVDLSYLLTGRGARQRKFIHSVKAAPNNVKGGTGSGVAIGVPSSTNFALNS